MKNNNKGFTLIEITLAIALLALIVLPISSMLINQSKSSIDLHSQNTVQQNAQTVMSAFRTKCIPASSIIELTNPDGTNILSSKTIETGFSKLVITNDTISENTTYEYDQDTKTFSYNGTEIAQDVEVKISPIPTSATYAKCKGIRVIVKSSNTDSVINKTHNVDIENQFYFRNASN